MCRRIAQLKPFPIAGQGRGVGDGLGARLGDGAVVPANVDSVAAAAGR